MVKAKSAIVIGAGIIGITSAYALAKQGWNVTILDAREGPALGASLGNGRQLSYSHTDALANPRLLTKLPSLALGADDTFRLSLKPDPALLKWLGQFLRNCTASRSRANTLANLALAEMSRRGMETLLQQHPIEFDQQSSGKLVLYRDEAEFGHAAKAMDLKVQQGSVQRAVDRDEALTIEPALGQCLEDLEGAIYSPEDRTGNCTLFASQLLKLAQREYGVNFLRNARVETLALNGNRARVQLANGDIFEASLAVVCAGHHSNRLLAPLGHSVPVQPMKGYSFTATKGESAPETSITDSKRRIVFTGIGDEILVAGIADLGNDCPKLDDHRMASMIQSARQCLPLAANYEAAGNFWTGHRPVTPNSLPITERITPSLAVNTGHGMLGWTLAMGSAAVLADSLGTPN